MTICNNTTDGHCELLFMILKILIQKPKTIEQVVSVLNPDDTHLSKPRSTINRWIELGLFTNDNGLIDLTKFAKAQLNVLNNGDLKKNLPYLIRRILFNKENYRSENLWTTTGANDFYTAFTWFMMQNPFTFHLRSWKSIVTVMGEQKKKNIDREIIQNDTRLQGLYAYGHYLGFLSGNRKNFIDPTQAILDDIDLLIKKNEEISFEEFLRRLNDAIPIFDKGNIRVEFEKSLDERYLDNIGEKTISPALSLSLIRLEEMNFLRISNKGDAENSYSFSKTISNKLISHMQRNNG